MDKIEKKMEEVEKLTSEQKAQNAITWIDGLSKTRVKQGQTQLGNSEYGYCCLGYGCMKLKIPFDYWESSSELFQKSVGLLTEEGNSKEPLIENDYFYSSLIDLNDGLDFSFRRMSTVIKKKALLLFEPAVAQIVYNHYNK